jgi:hypothetical protein
MSELFLYSSTRSMCVCNLLLINRSINERTSVRISSFSLLKIYSHKSEYQIKNHHLSYFMIISKRIYMFDYAKRKMFICNVSPCDISDCFMKKNNIQII